MSLSERVDHRTTAFEIGARHPNKSFEIRVENYALPFLPNYNLFAQDFAQSVNTARGGGVI